MINIVLYEPEIPQNTGNIMRTCAGTGVKLHLIKPLGFSLDDKVVKRCGVNYLEYCNYEVYENYDDFLSKNDGEFYYLTRYGTQAYSDFDYKSVDKNIYLVFGKESTGIPKEILNKNINRCLRIPINENIRALNVANSVCVVLFEVLRQKGFPDLLCYDTFKGKNYLIDE